MPDNSSPLWPILKTAVVFICAIVAVSVGYGEGWVSRSDIPVVLGILLPYLGIEFAQKLSASNR